VLPSVLTASLFTASAFGQLPSLGDAREGSPNGGARSGPTVGPSIGPSFGSTAPSPPTNLGWAFAAEGNGLKIERLQAGSLVAKAGFQVNDAIRAVNRNWVNSPADLADQLRAAIAAEGRAWVFVDRGARQEWVNLTFAANAPAMLGAELSEENGAVRIRQLQGNSLAAMAGLQAGDQIVTLNGRSIATTGDLVAPLQAAANGSGEVLIHVRRNGTLYQARTKIGRGSVTNVFADAAPKLEAEVAEVKTRVAELRSDIRDKLDAVGASLQATSSSTSRSK